jgi:hypothetical protein
MLQVHAEAASQSFQYNYSSAVAPNHTSRRVRHDDRFGQLKPPISAFQKEILDSWGPHNVKRNLRGYPACKQLPYCGFCPLG